MNIVNRILTAVFGAFLGALIALAAMWWLWDIHWLFVAISAAVCGVLTLVWGDPFIKVLYRVLKDVD